MYKMFYKDKLGLIYYALKDSEYTTLKSVLDIIIRYENHELENSSKYKILSCKVLGAVIIIAEDNTEPIIKIALLDFAIWYKRHYTTLTDLENGVFMKFLMEYSLLDTSSYNQFVTSIYSSCTELSIDIEYQTVQRAVGLMYMRQVSTDILKTSYMDINKYTKIVCRYSEDEKVGYIENTETGDVIKITSTWDDISVGIFDMSYDSISDMVVALESANSIMFVTVGGIPVITAEDIKVEKVQNPKRVLLLNKLKYGDEFRILK